LDGVSRNPLPQFSRPPWATMQRAPRVASLHAEATSGVRPAFFAVIGAVLLVLAIASVNVANLLLGRSVQQRGELAVRAALGANTARLVRQLLTETVMLALMGGVVGIAVAFAAVQALIALAPPNVPRLSAVAVDGSALLFALSVSTLVGVLLGLSPAVHASRVNPIAGLNSDSGRAVGGHRVARRTLVVTEVALALVLLVSAGLLLRSLNRIFAVDPGFEPAGLVTMQLQVSGQKYGSDTAIFEFTARALDAVRRESGVSSAAFSSQLPLSGDDDQYGAHFESSETGRTEGSVQRYGVTPRYFETMGIPLVRGRFIDRSDRRGAPLVMVINESFARRKFPGRDPIGQRVHLGPDRGPWFTIIGVAGDVKQLSLAASVSDAAYIPTDQSWFADRALWLVARGAGDPSALAARLRAAIWSTDKTQAVVRIGTMNSVVEQSAAHRRFALLVFEAFALVALVLAAFGIYGVISGTVSERFREIGVRSALGATSRDIVSLVIRQGLGLTVMGVAVGLPIALGATKLIVSMLYGVSRVDALTYAAVVALLIVVAGIACWIPAARAARVDPTTALRQ
jgi:putative ABC transport system permease protein